MQFGCLKCNPFSVPQVMAAANLDSQHVGVHGVIYYGEGCEEDEYLLLPKEGPFDGVGPISMPQSLDRSNSLLIEEPNMYNWLGGSSVSGEYRFKDDAILVGQIRRQPGTRHPVRIGDLWVVLMQDWADEGLGWTNHSLRLIIFPQNRLPTLPWGGFQGKRDAYPVIRVYPPPSVGP